MDLRGIASANMCSLRVHMYKENVLRKNFEEHVRFSLIQIVLRKQILFSYWKMRAKLYRVSKSRNVEAGWVKANNLRQGLSMQPPCQETGLPPHCHPACTKSQKQGNGAVLECFWTVPSTALHSPSHLRSAYWCVLSMPRRLLCHLPDIWSVRQVWHGYTFIGAFPGRALSWCRL